MVMPALVELHERGLLPQRWRLIGCATDRWDDEAFRARLRDSLLSSELGLPEDWDQVCRRVAPDGHFPYLRPRVAPPA